MTAAVYNIEDVEIASSERRSKETDMLPVPSTTPASRKETASVNHRLAAILQYINPLFYARLAQAFIYSVLESYRDSNTRNYNARITAGDMIAVPNSGPVVPTDSTAIDCGPPMLTDINLDDHFTSVAPEFDSILHLDTENIETAPPHETAVLADSSDITEEQLTADPVTNDGEVTQVDAMVSNKANNTAEPAKDAATIPVDSQTEVSTSVDQPIQDDLPDVSEDQPADDGLEDNKNTETSSPTAEVAKKLTKKNKRGKGKSKNKK
ncbi:hypothetical protein LPJ53_000965 [Coemansia erecta]|uniref:Uncharacterized protein n=1 Tax=Coemansia erecta TaxID=147472 RepID=A0A9W7Y0Z8_9FUNG|nr:hypothetical protein LPJ53_000965 [Coemansia erecta]